MRYLYIAVLCLALLITSGCSRSSVTLLDLAPEIDYVMYEKEVVYIGYSSLMDMTYKTFGIYPFLLDSEYAIPKQDWLVDTLAPRFLELYVEEPITAENFDPAKFSVYDCDNYAKDFVSLARLTHAKHINTDVDYPIESVAIGEVYIMMDVYTADGHQIGHVLNIIVAASIDERGISHFRFKFLEPQTGEIVTLSHYGTTEIIQIVF